MSNSCPGFWRVGEMKFHPDVPARCFMAASLALVSLSHVTPLFSGDDVPPSLHRPPVADAVVQRYLLTPQGAIDGLLLNDGSQLHITPRVTEMVASAIAPGDHVRVHGTRRSRSPVVQPDVIINVSRHTTYTMPFPLDLSLGTTDTPDPFQPMTALGTIEALLYDSFTGKINGLLLSEGTQVQLPQDVSDDFRQSLQLHAPIAVEGNGSTTAYGRAMVALAIGPVEKGLIPLTPSSPPLQR
jgi:hypothetical protein